MSDYFPEEILIQILVKLPVKSLICATRVCKAWRSLIRRPSFISAHRSSNTQNQALLRLRDLNHHEHYMVFPKGGPLAINSSSELEFPFICWNKRIVGSCDGLLCLCDDALENPSPMIIIWNPAIGDYVLLPRSPFSPTEFDSPLILLGFGVASNVYKVVTLVPFILLGFGVASNVYKVVRLVPCTNTDGSVSAPQVDIFSLGAETWRKLSGFDIRVYPREPGSIFLKGFVHWIVFVPCRHNNVYRNSILTFHVGDEILGITLLLPMELQRKEPEMSLSLTIIGGSLGAISYDEEMGNLICDIWMMKDYGVIESWTKLYRIETEGFKRVIGLWGTGEALLAVQGHEVVTYNAETKGIKHFGIFRNEKSSFMDYKESLVLFGGYRRFRGGV